MMAGSQAGRYAWLTNTWHSATCFFTCAQAQCLARCALVDVEVLLVLQLKDEVKAGQQAGCELDVLLQRFGRCKLASYGISCCHNSCVSWQADVEVVPAGCEAPSLHGLLQCLNQTGLLRLLLDSLSPFD